ncbi:hypothetical protein [Catenuloplanes indicus]|uniref:Uncharacterized protein n=1 Tax=Catenuloplanes indicus TaxID=137267 RepID=A0AAE4AV74_9ACTN|nr:hypothetical protein [Catenuloplanes indicus]MDQ0364590.1 hypothetical protein [Catenuloplanes indicus]
MPLPADMQARLSDPDFWRAYFFGDDDLADDEDGGDSGGGAELTAEDGDDVMAVEFPVGGGYALVLDVDVELRMITVEMRSPAHPDTLQLGWDDDAHWHPHVLRWDELDLIARAAAVHDPTLRHPGPVVALASRFVVLAPAEPPTGERTRAEPETAARAADGPPSGAGGDELDAITPLLDAAFGPPPPGADYWPSARGLVHRIDARHDGVRWRRTGTGDWTVEQGEGDGVDFALYSTRGPGGDFPFADWRALLAAAEATLATTALPEPASPAEEAWVEETRTGTPRGTLIAVRFGPSPLRGTHRYALRLSLHVRGRRYSATVAFAEDLDRTLREAGRGQAHITGSSSQPGAGTITEEFDIEVADDLPAGIALIRAVMARHDVAPETRLTRGYQPLD